MKKILFISGSVGLGHVSRDLAMAEELRRQNPDVEVSWLAASPASEVLKNARERLLPEADQWANDNIPAEDASKGGAFHLSVLKYLLLARKEWENNVEVFRKVTSKERFDLIIGDETYEISVALKKGHLLKVAPFVMVYDFVGLDSMTKNPMEKLGVYTWNKIWAKGYKTPSRYVDLTIFIGEEEDIPDTKLGFLLPNRRVWARARSLQCVGYVLPFQSEEYADKGKIRERLGYGKERLIICSIGGTSVGKDLLELCGRAAPIVRRTMPDIRMILVCGPRLTANSLSIPDGVEVREYVPKLYEHFAASDLAIIQGGGTTTLELTALRRPFLYFPLEGHFEQQLHVAGRLARHGAGIKLMYPETTPEILAENIISHIGREAAWRPIPTNGAQKAAQLLNQLLTGNGERRR
jgi:UDP-N-acetylglucosamine:LPS N-acetylglucosamine transferase